MSIQYFLGAVIFFSVAFFLPDSAKEMGQPVFVIIAAISFLFGIAMVVIKEMLEEQTRLIIDSQRENDKRIVELEKKLLEKE